MKSIRLEYFALLREQAGVASETVTTPAPDAGELYRELCTRHEFSIPIERLRVAVNGDFCTFDASLADGDQVVFIPPVAGG